MRPLECRRDIACPLIGETNPRLVVPDRIAQSAIVLESLVHYVPGKDLVSEVSDHRLDVIFKDGVELRRIEIALRNPVGVLLVPDKGVSTNAHSSALGERNQPVGSGEIVRLLIDIWSRMDRPELHCIFWFDACKFGGENVRILSVVEMSRIDRGTDKDVVARSAGFKRGNFGRS